MSIPGSAPVPGAGGSVPLPRTLLKILSQRDAESRPGMGALPNLLLSVILTCLIAGMLGCRFLKKT